MGVSTGMTAQGAAVGEAVRAAGRRFAGLACDLSDRAAVHAMLGRVRAEHPRIDVLVSNAGTIVRAPAAKHPDEAWNRGVAVNLSAQFVIAREVGREMVARGSGKIIFIASLLTFQGGINMPGYAASKGGVSQPAKAPASEWAGRGVNGNAIAPGHIDTDNTEALRADPARNAAILGRIPAGRWSTPADLAGPAVSWHQAPWTTCTARSWWWTAAG